MENYLYLEISTDAYMLIEIKYVKNIEIFDSLEKISFKIVCDSFYGPYSVYGNNLKVFNEKELDNIK